MSAYMGFKIADLVTGLGALFLALGVGGGVASGYALRQSQSLATEVVEEHRVPVTV